MDTDTHRHTDTRTQTYTDTYRPTNRQADTDTPRALHPYTVTHVLSATKPCEIQFLRAPCCGLWMVKQAEVGS